MEYLTYGYMIDNVALLITGTLHERDTRELLERCHPLGWFETMPVLCVATNIEELYNSVLIETPLAPYFKGSLSHQDLDELNIEIVRNTLYKNYLEDFYQWVNSDPEVAMTPTSEVMSEVLEFEADRRSINITLNSFGTELSKQDRKKLYPNFGKLYPEGTLMLSRADDPEGVRIAVDGVHAYSTAFDQTGMGQNSGGAGNMSGGAADEGKSLEDMFYQKEMEISKLAFTRQFTHAVVYAWVKLREQVRRHSRNKQDRELTALTGNSKHYVDCRVHRTEPKRQDRELHKCILELCPDFASFVLFFFIERSYPISTKHHVSTLQSSTSNRELLRSSRMGSSSAHLTLPPSSTSSRLPTYLWATLQFCQQQAHLSHA